MVSFTTIIESVSNHHFITIPADAAKLLEQEGIKRVMVFTDDHPPFHAAVLRRKGATPRISMGKRILKPRNYHAGMEISVRLENDTTEYQAQMPEEFREVLETDPEAQQIFESLTDGRKRSLIYMVLKTKRMQTRIDKALMICENLKRGITDPREFIK